MQIAQDIVIIKDDVIMILNEDLLEPLGNKEAEH